MLYLIIVTGRCNLNCTYCGGSISNDIMPSEITYSLEDLFSFLERDSEASIAFYGGEPLLRTDLIEKIVQGTEVRHYILQTNGLLLHRLSDSVLKKLNTILVSVDGIKEVNDTYRGDVYDKVMENINSIRRKFRGELIARMVATEKTDIFRDVSHLLNHFEYVHWQINAVWVEESFYRNFNGWIEKYKEGITRLVKFWVEKMETGVVMGIVPFLGVVSSFLGKKHPHPPCGSGDDSFTITTDGRVVACPVCADLEWNQAGDIWKGIIRKDFLDIQMCSHCRYFNICGGRCLFFSRERLWSREKMQAVCDATIHLIEEIKRQMPKIERLIERGVVEPCTLHYPEYRNTTEIIP
jgi:putative peptide-modifying radical SAM enzyme